MKKTFSVRLGNEDYVVALMERLEFVETERRTTGGHMSEEKVQLTFNGLDVNYHENHYIKKKTEKDGYYLYYSLRCLDGYYTCDFEIFKKFHDTQKETTFTIHKFKP